jgi:hypothetical protein
MTSLKKAYDRFGAIVSFFAIEEFFDLSMVFHQK